MNQYYRRQFQEIKSHVEALTEEEFEKVINYLVNTVEDFIDGDDSHPYGKYYYQSAAVSCAEDLGLESSEQLLDIGLLAFEFSMF